jgi:hypothetical protein
MIRLGLRLTVGGGREAIVRLVIIAAAVALGSSLLLITLAGINAVTTQNDRYLQPRFGCLRCSRRGCFVCISRPGGRVTSTLSTPQAWHASPCRCRF